MSLTAEPIAQPPASVIDADVSRALHEDLGSGDATADLLPVERQAQATLITRDAAVLAGQAWAEACFRRLDAHCSIAWNAHDGQPIAAQDRLFTLRGNARAIVSGERCALNFLQTLSATATETAKYVAAVRGTGARILDTRKTLPGLRLAQKYAVRCGGGSNHRVGLYDALLIKENHIVAMGSIGAAVQAARARHPKLLLEVEVENLDELEQALQSAADRVLLDDFSLADMCSAVALANGRTELEASGGIDLDSVRAIAETGVNFISVGALTKNVRAVDLSLRVDFHS